MLPKSCLLEFLIKSAEELKNNDGKKSLSADYFVISLLKVVSAIDSNQLPEELNADEVKHELDAVCTILKKYNIDVNEVIVAITEAINDESYKSAFDEFIFGKINYTAEAKAKKNDQAVIDTTVYLELIFAEPTAAINKFILANAPKEEKLQSEFTSNENRTPKEQTLKAPNSRKTEPGKPKEQEQELKSKDTAPETKDISGVGDLANIVRQTQDIQKMLLENIFGQDYAVNSFASGYFQSQLMASSRKETKKPKAMFLFAGPPGVGKTFLAEKAAEALGLPFCRFDMSEYSDNEATVEFCGSDGVYKNGKGGNVTSFVAANPKCVLLFDEIEKAHISIIYLFLQILDAGRIRDNHTDKVVSFSDATIIFTTNVGKKLYENSTANLSSIPRKKILKALETELNPSTGAPLFPAAICSRFASGNVIMFNHLEANNLYTIAKRELQTNIKGFEATAGIKVNIDDSVPSAIMFSEGGKADARTVNGRANAFFHEEMYELFRLLAANNSVESIKEINISVSSKGLGKDVIAMFEAPATPEVLVFASEDISAQCASKLKGKVICHFANTIDAAKDILFNHDINVVLCDVGYGVNEDVDVLNVEDVSSVGRDFLTYVLERYSLPVYLIQAKKGDITQEEFLSFAKLGVMDVITVKSRSGELVKQVLSKCEIAYQQGNMMKLARENKALSYKTSQSISQNKQIANINLFDFKFSLITDVDDSKSIVDNVSRPDMHFDDVIGAEDAKQELKYFVEYLKNPIKYMRKGVRAPKGVLLYGPPGTGKTLLAKAMAGESGVTFLKAEGNEFLKKYIGEGAEAVHSLFSAARKYAPSIVFIDEIDAIGKDRGLSDGSSSSGDILTAFLTEMDGFNTDTSKPVFVLAATNYGVDSEKGKSLDAALLRRFDRRIYVDLPNKEERKKYLKMKLSKYASVKLSEEQINNIAMRSTGMSLAELESIFEMALRSAIRTESGTVGDAEFEEAFETFNSGEKKEWNPDTLKRVARHEAGHAFICWLSGEKPSYLTVVARGDHGGYMQHANSEGKGIYTKSELLSKIRTSLGGRASEIVYYGKEDGVSTGASGDLYSATRIAEQMICNYGMDQSVGMSYIEAGAVNGVSSAVREKVNAILEQELNNAIDIIATNKKAIDTMVDTLIERNHLNEKEIDDIFRSTAVSAVNN